MNFTMNGQQETIGNLTISRIEIEFTVFETSIAAAALCLILLLTIIGNCTICYVVFKNKRMWTVMNMFLVNLAVGDLAVGLLSMVFPLVTAIKRTWIFNDTICQINAGCNSVLFCSTIFTHTAISIDRYFALVRPMKKFMTAKKAALLIIAVWVFSFVIVLGPVFGWGHMEFNPTTLQCGYGFPRTKYESLYMILLMIIAFVIPLIMMTVLYFTIFRSLRGHTRRMSTTISGNHHQAALKAQIRVGSTFFLALLAFFVCWAPFCVFIAYAVAVEDKTSIPHGLGIAAYWCGFVNSLCNPFIVGIRNEHCRSAFIKIFCCCCYGPRRTKPSSPSEGIPRQNGPDRPRRSRNHSRSNTDSDTRVTEMSLANRSSNRSSHSSYIVDARHIRQELDRDAAHRDASADCNPENEVFESNPKRKRKTAINNGKSSSLPQLDKTPYDQFIHIVGGSSYRESGV